LETPEPLSSMNTFILFLTSGVICCSVHFAHGIQWTEFLDIWLLIIIGYFVSFTCKFFSKPPARPATTGVASYGALVLHTPLNFQLFNFSGHFRAAQTLTFDSMDVVSYAVKDSSILHLPPPPTCPKFCAKPDPAPPSSGSMRKGRSPIITARCYAERGYATVRRPSARLSVCNVQVS